MTNLLVLGAGKIGSLITCLMVHAGYRVHLVDQRPGAAAAIRDRHSLENCVPVDLDASDRAALDAFLGATELDAVVSGLPYYCNVQVAKAARAADLHYFDLTEDIAVTEQVKAIADGSAHAFIPQCGLAPGFISIVANAIMQRFSRLDSVKMRVGALPLNPNNALKYSLTWSTDGLINEYGNLCQGIQDGAAIDLLPLEGLESITLDGSRYEAFNTSGGLGTLAESYAGRVRTLNYKTIRYPGHCEQIRLLMNDLNLNQDRETLKRILENAVPKTLQDVVLIYVAVTGMRDGDLFEENYARKIYAQEIAGSTWSAIQVSTAAGVCAVVDLVINDPDRYSGFVTQEQFGLEQFTANRFGRYYAQAASATAAPV